MIYNTIESHTVLLMMAVVIDFEPLDGDNMVTMFLVFSCFFSWNWLIWLSPLVPSTASSGCAALAKAVTMVPMDFWSNDMPVASTEWLDGQLGYWKNRFLRVVLWDFLWNLGLFMAFRVVSCLGGISLGLLALHLQRHRRHKFDTCHNSTRIPTTTTAKYRRPNFLKLQV